MNKLFQWAKKHVDRGQDREIDCIFLHHDRPMTREYIPDDIAEVMTVRESGNQLTFTAGPRLKELLADQAQIMEEGEYYPKGQIARTNMHALLDNWLDGKR